jgi:beta-1,4-mannosyl-glycoprotein beta-1,4-N-acetylglucosaminyltransferase
MIIDTFTFWKELDILEIRLNELYDTVDKFVLVEAAHTQSLQPKPYYFEENKSRFSQFLDKIVHIKVDEKIDISQNPWAFENFQRQCIAKGLNQLSVTADDYILVSDVDEVPRAECLKRLLPNMGEILCFGMTYNVYFLNLVMRHKLWPGTVAMRAKDIQCDMHTLIKLRDRLPHHLIPCDTGWHLGYQGGEQGVFDKYFSCIEPFNKNDIPAREKFSNVFKERAKDQGSFIFCDNLDKQDLILDQIPIEKLPKYVQNNQNKFKSFLL